MVDRFQYFSGGRTIAEFTSDGTLITHDTAAAYIELADRCVSSDQRGYLRLLAVIAELRARTAP